MIFFRAKKAPQGNAKANDQASRILPVIKNFLTIFFILVVLAGLIGAYIYLHKPQTLPIKTIQVIGDYDQVDHQTIETAVLPYTENGFLNLNLDVLQQSLLNVPWIAQAEIRKVWPDTVVIDLQQQVPVAYWNNNSLLSDQGTVFTPKNLNNLPLNLPKFVAPDSQAKLVLDTYRKINQNLDGLQLTIVAINLTERHAWTVTLNNGIILILGREDLTNRLQRFIETYPKVIADKADKVTSIDLRYDSGLAVQWKTRL